MLSVFGVSHYMYITNFFVTAHLTYGIFRIIYQIVIGSQINNIQ